MCQNVLFHFYRHRKSKITELRLWFIAKYVIDHEGKGSVAIKQLAKISKLKTEYVRRLCRGSTILFNGCSPNRAYYRSLRKVLKDCRLTRPLQIRGERLNQTFVKQLQNKKSFVGMISKFYVERDRNKKHRKITNGRISYWNLAKYFGISRRTAIYNIKKSTAKGLKNRYHYPNITFQTKKDFEKWLLPNMGTKIGRYIVGENPNSYHPRWFQGKWVLAQDLPNIYQFTGVYLVSRRRGTSN